MVDSELKRRMKAEKKLQEKAAKAEKLAAAKVESTGKSAEAAGSQKLVEEAADVSPLVSNPTCRIVIQCIS